MTERITEIPEGWKMTTPGEVAVFQRGFDNNLLQFYYTIKKLLLFPSNYGNLRLPHLRLISVVSGVQVPAPPPLKTKKRHPKFLNFRRL